MASNVIRGKNISPDFLSRKQVEHAASTTKKTQTSPQRVENSSPSSYSFGSHRVNGTARSFSLKNEDILGDVFKSLVEQHNESSVGLLISELVKPAFEILISMNVSKTDDMTAFLQLDAAFRSASKLGEDASQHLCDATETVIQAIKEKQNVKSSALFLSKLSAASKYSPHVPLSLTKC